MLWCGRPTPRDHRQKIWALWALGLLGNRGLEPDHVVQVLAAHLKDGQKRKYDKEKRDKNEDTRRWAVEGLALVGTTSTIAPLLETMRNDPSPVVREHAACSLAQSGMLSREQRLIAVPQLIDYSADLPRRSNSRLGLPGSGRHHPATPAQ